MAKEDLVPFNKLTEEEQKKLASMGGKASAKARAEKADFKKKCLAWMEAEVAKDSNGNPLTGADLMVYVAGREIKEGSPKFWELMRDTAGFKPVEKVVVAEVDQEVIDEVENLVKGVGDEDARV